MEPANYFVETPWETRNLGIPSYALSSKAFIKDSQMEALTQEFARLKKGHARFFVFARVPRDYLHLSQLLEHVGFYVVECTIAPFIRLIRHEQLDAFEKNNDVYLPQKFRNTALTISSVACPELEIAAAIKKVASESFADDRFHVDPNCSAELADRRFVYWVDDLINNEKVYFDLLYVKDEMAGFMARKGNQLILAGFSKTYRMAGLGEFFWLASCSMLKKKSYKTAETLISINNIPVLNLYASLGFKFKDPQYSLHYWGNP